MACNGKMNLKAFNITRLKCLFLKFGQAVLWAISEAQAMPKFQLKYSIPF